MDLGGPARPEARDAVCGSRYRQEGHPADTGGLTIPDSFVLLGDEVIEWSMQSAHIVCCDA